MKNAEATELATLMELDEEAPDDGMEATQIMAEQPGGVPPVVSEQKAEKITEQPDIVPLVSEQNAEEKITEQPGGGVPPVVVSEQKPEKITEQPGVPPMSEQKSEKIPAQPGVPSAVSEQKAEKIPEQPGGVPSAEQKAEEKIPEQPGVPSAVSEQKAEKMTEQSGSVPPLSEQKEEKITEQPGGVPFVVSEQNAEEKIAGALDADHQMVATGQDGQAKSKLPASGAVRFAVDNPQLLHRFDFKDSFFTSKVFWEAFVCLLGCNRTPLKEGVMALKPGETEQDRDCRLAHNLYVRYTKSLKSNFSCR